MPLTSLASTKFEQPFLGANYLSIDIKPVAGGGLTNGTRAEIRLKDKGIFEFASSLDKTRERAIYMKRQQLEDEEGLRACFLIRMGDSVANEFIAQLLTLHLQVVLVPRHLPLDLLMTIFLPVTTPNSMNDTPGFVSIAKGTMYSCTLNVDE